VESETPVAPGIRLATPHLRANRCGDLLRRFHPFGEMLEARHLHSNEHLQLVRCSRKRFCLAWLLRLSDSEERLSS